MALPTVASHLRRAVGIMHLMSLRMLGDNDPLLKELEGAMDQLRSVIHKLEARVEGPRTPQ